MLNIKLQSSDGEIFDVDIKTAMCSGTIRTKLEENGNAVVLLPEVTSVILQKVLIWTNYHKHDAQPIYCISSWDADFLNVDKLTIIELLSAAHYLDIKDLVQVTSKTIANWLTGKTPEQMREILFF